MHLLVSEQYVDSIMHGATIKVISYNNIGLRDTWSVVSDFVVPVSVFGLNDVHLLYKLSLFHDVITKFDCISVFSREV